MKKCRTVLLATILLSGCAIGAENDTLTFGRWRGPLELDGELNEPAWATVDPLQMKAVPESGKEAGENLAPTAVKMLADENGLYLGIRCEEPHMSGLKANLTDRDSGVSAEDCLEIFMDPGATGDRYYQFQFNPLSTQADVEVLEGGRVGSSLWDGDWKVKVLRDAKGWTGEVFIPWANFGGKGWNVPVLGLNVTRERYATGERELYTLAPLERFADARSYLKIGALPLDPARFGFAVNALELGVTAKGKAWLISPEVRVVAPAGGGVSGADSRLQRGSGGFASRWKSGTK